MNGKRLCRLVVVATIFLLMFSNESYSAEKFEVSIPFDKIDVLLKKGDRISAYTVEMNVGRVYSILKIADDWWTKSKDVEIPQLEAWAFHGTGYLSIDDIKKEGFFNKFLVIETWPEEGTFDITVKFTLENLMEEKPKHILIKKKDITIAPIK